MFRFLVIALCTFGLASTNVPKQQVKIVVPEQVQASHDLASIPEFSGYEGKAYGGEFGAHITDDETHSNGAELTSLAHSSAVRASNAVQNQQSAGSQAAFSAANGLASAALGAAQTAQAALVGKQAIVQNLKRQLTEAQQQLQKEINHYQQSGTAALAAHEAVQQAQLQTSSLAEILSAAQGSVQQAEQAAAETAKVAASQQSMVLAAKERLAHVYSQVQNALGELHETEISAQRAADAAQIAQANAASAGATVGSAGGKGNSSGNHHY